MTTSYWRTLARCVGQRWSAANRADMQRLAALLVAPSGASFPALAEAAPAAAPPPPADYRELEADDPQLAAFMQQRRAEVASVRRMVRTTAES